MVQEPNVAAGMPCEACASWASLQRAALPMLPHLAVQAQTRVERIATWMPHNSKDKGNSGSCCEVWPHPSMQANTHLQHIDSINK